VSQVTFILKFLRVVQRKVGGGGGGGGGGNEHGTGISIRSANVSYELPSKFFFN
jgi:hypothetical protein